MWHIILPQKLEKKRIKNENLKDVNVDGTKNLIEAAVDGGVGKFIYFSSVAVYGLPIELGNIRNFDEKHEHTYCGGYGQTKSEAEKLIIHTAKKSKL